MRLLKSAACGLILCAVAAGPAFAVEPDAPGQLITRLDAVGHEVRTRLEAGFEAGSETESEQTDHGAMVEFYSDNDDHQPLWVTADGLTPKAKLVMDELRRAGDYGLNAADYELPEMPGGEDKLSLGRLAGAEVALSTAALAYVRHARGGRMEPGSISRNLDPTLNLADPLEVMEELAKRDDPGAYIRGFHPKHQQFEALRQVLLKLRGGYSEEKRIAIPKGPVIKPGERHEHVAIIRERLKVDVPQGDNSDRTPMQLYDEDLENAVKDFQKVRGLTVDGVIGPATRLAMNGGAQPKNNVKTILANMERWRWIPDSAATSLNVQANVPEFMVRVYDEGEEVFLERIVVGKAKNATPIFSDEMERIEFNPYWNVPNSIKVEEILPNLRRRTTRRAGGFAFFENMVTTQGNPRWVARNNLRIKYNGRVIDPTKVDWSRTDIRKYHVYQPPGGPNVLGKVKFMFPNKHIVYMHDTTSKHLFNQSVRAESHGCMRVRNPDRFAKVLLSRVQGWSDARVDNAFANGKHQPVHLEQGIPVHITYFTARVRENGTVRYFRDLYGHDTRMARALKL